MTAGVLLEAAASLLTVELFDEVPEELLVPEPLLEYERLLEYEPPLEEKLVRFLLLVYPDFLDQLLYFLLLELLEEPLRFLLGYPDFLPVYPELLFPLEVSRLEYARRGVDCSSQSRSLLAARLGLAACRLRWEDLLEAEPCLLKLLGPSATVSWWPAEGSTSAAAALWDTMPIVPMLPASTSAASGRRQGAGGVGRARRGMAPGPKAAQPRRG